MKAFKSEIQAKKILVIFVMTTLFFIAGTAAQYKKSAYSTNNDFWVYYKTSERISTSNWQDIYTRKDGPFPYRYIPYSLMAISWIDHFPEIEARKIWVVIQATAFAAGFYYLYLSLVFMGSEWPLLAVCLSILLSFRHYIDSLYSGQVAGIVFLSFTMGLNFFLKKRMILDGAVNSVAASLKIFPGILIIHGFIKTPGISKKLRFLFLGILLFIAFNILFMLWIKLFHQDASIGELWRNWIEICRADSEYFDGSTPKSQSLRSFMLRVFGKTAEVEMLWKILTLVGIAALIVYWCRKSAETIYEEGFGYCLGIMAFIFLMPESLPYQVMNVAIPLGVLISHPKMKTNLSYKLMLGCFAIFMSFASTDFIGRWPSDRVQALSLPFFVMCFLTCLLFNKDHVVKT
ncbi:MAG: DUF2029 domain-containing protein [Bacteriovorax sp.]|nr:DUF2029 domain-containing protein [Bacteriovorax sp.]